MEFFLDSIDLNEIKDLSEFIDGITTNPSLIAKSEKKSDTLIAEICLAVKGPVSAQVTATDCDKMIEEGLKLAKIAKNVIVKLPLTYDGLRACKILSEKHKIKVNITLCFSTAQAILAAKAGAYFVSPFIGRLDDLSFDGLSLIEDIATVYSNYDSFNTKILVASVRSPVHVVEAAKLGADAVTMPAKVLRQLFSHPLTDSGLSNFLQDWNKSSQK
ncbi:MAG: putative transaldolase [Candidatus Mesenet longicola]|uniref:Transaldolase n=1 Tax=Candidatus Mesenet longicola TaxID=1892558 RepID=A0A8J3HYH9_9RICK|nr:MAG: putative transaldolase [Candidatus Mesenet longicola]GHM59896.1 MAG: putative transaldolase [Candidatus Mesenet longicola]